MHGIENKCLSKTITVQYYINLIKETGIRVKSENY